MRRYCVSVLGAHKGRRKASWVALSRSESGIEKRTTGFADPSQLHNPHTRHPFAYQQFRHTLLF